MVALYVDGEPATTEGLAVSAAVALNWKVEEPDDAALGLWLVMLPKDDARTLERGFIDKRVKVRGLTFRGEGEMS